MRNHEDTKRTKEHETFMLRIQSPLPDDLEQLAHDVIGCCIRVHRELGPGLLETIYARAVVLELTAAGVPFETEKSVPVRYRGELLCHQRLDLLVGGRPVLELKSVEHLDSIHVAQVLSYLRVAGVLGLLIAPTVYARTESKRDRRYFAFRESSYSSVFVVPQFASTLCVDRCLPVRKAKADVEHHHP
jgi:GxxExxY protein